MNKNLQEPTVQVSARRRLVRGAFAAPVALSLYSGSAFATTSLSCLAKEVNIGKQLPDSTVGPTGPVGQEIYIRVQLYTMTKTADPDKGAMIFWIKGADLVGLNAPNSYVRDGEWKCFSAPNINNPPFTAGQKITSVPAATDWQLSATANGRYVALRMNEAGEITGVVGLNDGSGYAVHQSCWASFKPT